MATLLPVPEIDSVCEFSLKNESSAFGWQSPDITPGKRKSLSKARLVTLSSLPYEEYVSEFGRLFTEGFDVQDEFAQAVFDVCSEDIIGVALGAKSVTLPEPDAVDGDNRQVRPCMVVMVTTEDNKLELQPRIVENVLKVIWQKHKDTDHYVPEPNTELPHWMKFLLYKPEQL